jgi:transposase
MGHLDDVTEGELRTALDRVEGRTPTLRLVAAIAYKNGVTQTELADWFGVQRRTIYNWLTRFDDRPIEAAVRDDDRPGRPRKLDPEQQNQLYETLRRPPTDAGRSAEEWTPELVREFVRDRFEVRYSLPSCRRLLNEAERADR